MPTQSGHAIPSIRSPANELSGVLRILEEIETFGAETGRICFGHHGEVLVEGRRVCWAVAATMSQRLTDRLRRLRNPPLTREQLEAVFMRCRSDGTPVGEALVSSGLVAEAALRTALLLHASDALARLGEIGAVQTDFVAHNAIPYDGRFAFSTAELLARVGARDDALTAALARSKLGIPVFDGRDAFAFARPASGATPKVIAVKGCGDRSVSEILDAADWASDSLPESRRARFSTEGGESGLAVLRERDVCYVLFGTRAHGGVQPRLSSISRLERGAP